MNLNNFTIKAQEAVQQAVQLVTKNNQQVIEPVHLLKAVIMTGESVTNFIFQKLGVNAQNLNMVLDRSPKRFPPSTRTIISLYLSNPKTEISTPADNS